MPVGPPDVPPVLKDSAIVFAIIANQLGFADMTLELIVRGNRLLDAAMTGDAAAVLGDDLDAHSVMVGFSAALHAFAGCMGAVEGGSAGRCGVSADRIKAIQEQMRKADDN